MLIKNRFVEYSVQAYNSKCVLNINKINNTSDYDFFVQYTNDV